MRDTIETGKKVMEKSLSVNEVNKRPGYFSLIKWRSLKPSLITIENLLAWGVNLRGRTKPETGIFLELFDSVGRMISTFYGCKSPTTGSSFFEEFENKNLVLSNELIKVELPP